MSSRDVSTSMTQSECHYPDDAQGSCLVIGIPPADRKDEPVPIDLVRSMLHVVAETQDRLSFHRPQARTRVEVFGAIPRELMNANAADAVRSVLENDNGDGTGDSSLQTLRMIEEERGAIVRAIGDEFQVKDMDVFTLTEKLKDHDARREFIDAFSAARGQLNRTLFVEKGGSKNPLVLRQALIELVPDWQKKGATPEVLDRLINYALAEILWIVRKATKQIVLFHYPRERRYLDLARAYMDQVLGFGDEVDLVSEYVVMPEAVDGLKLPPVIPEGRLVKKKTIRAKPCEPYRVAPNQEQQRILVYPADSHQAIIDKLSRSDLLKNVRLEYIAKMIVPILMLVRNLTQKQARTRRDFARLLPEGVLEDTGSLISNEMKIIQAFYELVIEPLGATIQEALDRLHNPTPGGMPFGGGGSGGSASGGGIGSGAVPGGSLRAAPARA